VILAILTLIVIPLVMNIIKKAKDAAKKVLMRMVGQKK